jgi:ubiquinone/menaquinone biosynthesis C-methylase UbiE
MDTQNITSNKSLQTRLNANRVFGSFDFHAWVYKHYAFAPGMDILDVGSGNGAQAIEALKRVGPNGSITALDLSPESIAQLIASSGAPANLQAMVGDMRELARLIAKRFRVKRYDLAYSTYALFYALDHLPVLEAMRSALKSGARMIVTTPVGPNGLRQLVNQLGFVTPELDQMDRFASSVIEPYFRAVFARVDIQIGRNLLRIPSVKAFAALYRSTAYYFPEAEDSLLHIVRAEIAAHGHFAFEKNAYMIIGYNDACMR